MVDWSLWSSSLLTPKAPRNAVRATNVNVGEKRPTAIEIRCQAIPSPGNTALVHTQRRYHNALHTHIRKYTHTHTHSGIVYQCIHSSQWHHTCPVHSCVPELLSCIIRDFSFANETGFGMQIWGWVGIKNRSGDCLYHSLCYQWVLLNIG